MGVGFPGSCQHLPPRLDEEAVLCISPDASDSQSGEQNQAVQDQSYLNSPNIVEADVVYLPVSPSSVNLPITPQLLS